MGAVVGAALVACHGDRSSGSASAVHDTAQVVQPVSTPLRAADAGTEEHFCTMQLALCGLQAFICLRESLDRIRSSTLTFCRDDRCASTSLAPLGRRTLHVSVPYGPSAFISMQDRIPEGVGAHRITVGTVENNPEAEHYEIVIRSADGTTLVDEKAAVTVSEPYGPGCGDCRQAWISHACHPML